MKPLLPLVVLAFLLGCGGADVTTGTGGRSVTVSPKSVSLLPGGSQLFSAKVGGSTDQTVTWSVAGGSSDGTFTGTSGLYTAPNVPGTYTVLATSNAFPGLADTATVLVTTPISVTVSPKTATLGLGGTQLFTATVAGSPNQAVTWSVNGDSTHGSFSGTSGLYTAPNAYGTYTITATSVADPTRIDTATITVAGVVGVTISPGTTTVLPGGSATFTATVTGTADTDVTWSVDSPANGCSIDPGTGAFTASTTPGTYTVRATSKADSSKSATARVVVSSITLALTPMEVTLDQGAQQVFTASLVGTTNLQVDWTLVGSSSSATCLTGPYTYTAPASAGTHLLQAASVANPAALQTATIHVNPVTLSLAPTSAVLPVGGTLLFTATVAGTTTPGVTWSILKNSSSATGTINDAGLYMAPSSPGTDTVQATATGDTSVIRTAIVTVGQVTISPASPAAVAPSAGHIQFSATVAGVSDQGVTWTILPAPNDGLITPVGYFTAPSAVGVYRVRATSTVNSALFAEVQVTVQ